MKQRTFNNLAKKEIAEHRVCDVAQAWKLGYLYAMNNINEYYGDDIEEISCLCELTEELEDAENLHE